MSSTSKTRFTRTSSSTNPLLVDTENKKKKKFLRETGFNQIINEIIIGLCQKYMNINIRKRIYYYFFLVFVGGIFCDLFPNFYLKLILYKTEKKDILNIYFVKLGWFWTLSVLIPFIILLNKTVSNSKKWANFKDLNRIIICTLVWYFSVKFFGYVEQESGYCVLSTFKNKKTCLQYGYEWFSFDISGHTFLLIFSNLIFFEESLAIIGFENFGYLLDSKYQQMQKIFNKKFDHYLLYNQFLVYVRILYILITCFSLLWDFMLIQTIFHYHNFVQKITACIWATLCWYFCYKKLFPSNFLNLIQNPRIVPNQLKTNEELDSD